jgi:hypothetical protein
MKSDEEQRELMHWAIHEMMTSQHVRQVQTLSGLDEDTIVNVLETFRNVLWNARPAAKPADLPPIDSERIAKIRRFRRGNTTAATVRPWLPQRCSQAVCTEHRPRVALATRGFVVWPEPPQMTVKSEFVSASAVPSTANWIAAPTLLPSAS